MGQLGVDGFTARLREELGVMLMEGDDVILLFETILSDAIGGVGNRVFVELL